MNCKKCGITLSLSSNYCSNCGIPVDKSTLGVLPLSEGAQDNILNSDELSKEIVEEFNLSSVTTVPELEPQETVETVETTVPELESQVTVETVETTVPELEPQVTVETVETTVPELEPEVTVETVETTVPKLEPDKNTVSPTIIIPGVPNLIFPDTLVVPNETTGKDESVSETISVETPEAESLVEELEPLVETQTVETVNVPESLNNMAENHQEEVTETIFTTTPEVLKPTLPDTSTVEHPVSEPKIFVVPKVSEVNTEKTDSLETKATTEETMIEELKPISETPVIQAVEKQPIVMPEAPKQLPIEQFDNQQSDNKIQYFIIGLFLVTAVVVGVMFFVFGDKDKNKESKPQPSVVEASTYDFVDGKFTYKIPNTYTAQAKDGYIALYNSTYYIEFSSSSSSSFNGVSEAAINQAIEDLGASVVETKTTRSNGKSYVVVRSTYDDLDCLFVFDKTATDYAMVGFGYNLNYTYDETLESEIISIMDKVKYSSSANLETKIDIDLSKIFKI